MKSREDYVNFLVWAVLKFPPQGDRDQAISACIWTAYRDMQRTLRGFGKHPSNQKGIIKKVAEATLTRFLEQTHNVKSQNKFDKLHEYTCSELRKAYEDNGFDSFSIGHAQKWVNMAVKYVFVLGECHTGNHYQKIYGFCHVPIDAYILGMVEPEARIGVEPWSKIANYDDYFAFQKRFRDKYPTVPPLDTEFDMWLEASRDRQA